MTDTPHDPLPDDLLASAFVDGDLSPSDRASVAADPALMARVAEFTAQRQRVGEQPDESVAARRESAIAFALAEFDRLQRSAAPDRSATVARWTPRTTRRLLAVAAAVVALGVVGVTVLGSDSSDLETSSPAAAEAKVAANAANADAATSIDAGSTKESVAPTATIGAIDAPATAAVTISDAAGLLALAGQQSTGGTQVADDSVRTQMSSPCLLDGDTFLSDVIYQGTLGIAITAADGHARILDASCAVLLDIVP